METFFSVSQNRARLRDAATSWVGTPFHENGRVKGLNGGVSCVGLIYAISLEIGLIKPGEIELPHTPIAWNEHNDFSLLGEFFRSPQIRDHIKRLDISEGPEVGDLITLRVKQAEHHLCWLIEPDKVIHCHRKKGVMITDTGILKPIMEGIYRIIK